MSISPDLILNAVTSGLLLGCFYAIASIGLAVSFGMLDVVNIAHPAFMVLAAFIIATICAVTSLDPLLVSVLLAPLFALAGAALYRGYHVVFERRGEEHIRGLAFFFGLLFIVEVLLLMVYGADQRWVEVGYSGRSVAIGSIVLPLRMLLPALLSLATIGALFGYLNLTYTGRAIAAVAQDGEALRFLAINPVRIKTIAFAISLGLAAVAGGCLIVVQPVDPHSAQVFIGRAFAIVIMGGLGSLSGALIAALLFGVIENLTATLYGPSWSPAVAFGLLLAVLVVRPQGIFGKAT